MTGAHDTVLDYADLFSVTLRDDNVQEFDTRWDEVLLSMTKIPSDEILESLYKLRIREFDQLKRVLELYDLDIHQKKSSPDYQQLKTMVKRRKDQKLRLRNFDARHGRIESGAVVKSRKGTIGVEGGKGICYQWKEKCQCSLGDRCSFRHVTQDRAQKPEHTAATHSEAALSRGRSVSVKRSIRGKSNHGSIARQLCRYDLKGTCTRTPCKYWHPLECQFNKTKRVVRRETRVSFLIKKLITNKTKCGKKASSRKKEKVKTKALWLSKKSVSQLGGAGPSSMEWRNARTGPQWDCAKRSTCGSSCVDTMTAARTPRLDIYPLRLMVLQNLTIGLCITGLGCTRFSRNKRVSGRPDAESLERNSKSSIHWVHATSSMRGKKGPSLGKTKVVPRQRSPCAPKFEDRSHEESGRQQRCAQSKAWDLAIIYTSSKRTTGLRSSHLQRSGFFQVPHQESRVRESLQLIPGRVCMRSVKKTSTLLSWRP